MTARATAPSLSELLRRADELGRSFAARAAEHDRDASFPFENFEALQDLGLMNLTVPERFGGHGAGLVAACRATEAIAKGEPSTALVYAMHLIYHGVGARSPHWSQPPYEQMARDSIARIAPINVMRVEPELGTPARGGLPSTTATPVDGGWSISGHKLYSTGCPILSYYLVWARTAGDDPSVGYFAVPADAPGIRIVETWDHLGMRATGSHDTVYEDVRIPADFALDVRKPADWMPPDPVQGSWNNLVLSALYHGIAIAARDWLAGYLHERMPANLGASLATLPRFQAAVGEMQALLWSSDRLIYGLAEQLDTERYLPALASQTSMAKFVATNNAVKVVDIALGLIGNPGLSRTNPLERYHRDVLCSRIHMPQDDMVLSIAGRTALGLQEGR
ncbi:MAG: acyl-CoA dehydrogenase family protein [Dehalococcoidia bacterium]